MSGLFGKIGAMFGGGAKEPAAVQASEAEIYKDYQITSEPIPEGAQFRLAGRILSKTSGKEHHFIRADVFTSRDDADKAAMLKARRLIDELGERLFS